MLPTYVSLLGAVLVLLQMRSCSSIPHQLYFRKYFSLFKRDYSLMKLLILDLFSRVKDLAPNSYKLLDRGFLELLGHLVFGR
jgi:hypothetical protein